MAERDCRQVPIRQQVAAQMVPAHELAKRLSVVFGGPNVTCAPVLVTTRS